MRNIYIAMEAMSTAVISILLFANIFETKRFTKRKIIFIYLLAADFILSFVDWLTWLDLGWAKMSLLFSIFVSISYVLSFAVQSIFAEYLYSYISDKVETDKKLFNAVHYYSLIICILTIYMCISGKLFTVVDGIWHSGELESAYYFLYLISLIYFAVIIFINVKKLGTHDFLAAFSFVLFPIVSLVVTVLTGFNLAVPLISIDALIIYIMLESDDKDVLIHWSNYDELTGLLNRRAYETDLGGFRNNLPEDFVYVSIDVNGLKQVNDNLGHDAGDEIITAAAKCLRNTFGQYGKVYRIGGDEFAAMIKTDNKKLNSLKEDLENEVNNFKGKLVDSLSVSAGYVTRSEYPEASIEEIARISDDRMYSDKSVYYQKNGNDRRSQKDAHKALCDLYIKILKINLSNDSAQIVNMNLDELDDNRGYSDKISVWFRSFAESGQVHPDDLEKYHAKANIEYIDNYFKENRKVLHIFYRRKYGDEFKNTMMEIIPANDFSEDNKTLYLYVKEIDE